MNTELPRQRLRSVARWGLWTLLALMIAGLVAAAALTPDGRKAALSVLDRARSAFTAIQTTHVAHDEDDDDDHDHDHGDGHDHDHDHGPGASQKYNHVHDEASAIKLSKQARGNIGLRLTKVELKPFERTISVPGIVVQRPGWSIIEVTAPMTGVVARVYPIQGESIEPRQPLFEIRLTHEDLLQSQTDFLRTIAELDVTDREVARLEELSAGGVIPGKLLIECEYEQQKLRAAFNTLRQALLLHGLSPEEVAGIETTRKLVESLTVCAPEREVAEGMHSHPLQVKQLDVSQGKYVNPGDTLCTLMDYGELYIEGQAFEQDVPAITRASTSDAPLLAVWGEKSTAATATSTGLKILYLNEEVDPQSRTFRFYVSLPNRPVRETKTPDGRRFVYWQFRPGQRAQLRVPIEQWKARIVLPVEAVVQDGAEAYAFEANGDHFDRRPVRVDYRDQDWVVIADDGALKIGSMVAASAAHQVQLALKAQTGGGVDPHAGHNH